MDVKDAKKSSEKLLNPNYAMVMRAAEHPIWLHKIVTHAKNNKPLPNSCINSPVPAGTSQRSKAINSKPVPATALSD